MSGPAPKKRSPRGAILSGATSRPVAPDWTRSPQRSPRGPRSLQRLLGRPWVETALGGLIIISAALTVVETTASVPTPAVVYGVVLILLILVLPGGASGLFVRLQQLTRR